MKILRQMVRRTALKVTEIETRLQVCEAHPLRWPSRPSGGCVDRKWHERDRCEPPEAVPRHAVPTPASQSRECMLSIIAAHEAMRRAAWRRGPRCCRAAAVDHARNQPATEFLEGGCRHPVRRRRHPVRPGGADQDRDGDRPVVRRSTARRPTRAMTGFWCNGEGEHTMVDGCSRADARPDRLPAGSTGRRWSTVAEGIRRATATAMAAGSGGGSSAATTSRTRWASRATSNTGARTISSPATAPRRGLKPWTIPDMTLGHCGEKVHVGNWAEWDGRPGAAKRKEAA